MTEDLVTILNSGTGQARMQQGQGSGVTLFFAIIIGVLIYWLGLSQSGTTQLVT